MSVCLRTRECLVKYTPACRVRVNAHNIKLANRYQLDGERVLVVVHGRVNVSRDETFRGVHPNRRARVEKIPPEKLKVFECKIN